MGEGIEAGSWLGFDDLTVMCSLELGCFEDLLDLCIGDVLFSFSDVRSVFVTIETLLD